MSSIIDLVGNLIYDAQNAKKERYAACGCASCKRRIKDINAFLDGSTVDTPPDVYDEIQEYKNAITPIKLSWLCYNCQRKVSAVERCPYCGTPGGCAV